MNKGYGRFGMGRRIRRRGLLRGAGAAGAGLAGAALVGCAGGDEEPDGGTPTAGTPTGGTPTGNGTATATGTPPAVSTGGTLQVGYTLEPSSLDPHLGVSGGDAYYWGAIFDQLVGADETNALSPDRSLAESWEVEDETTITFHLRQGVKFHDGSDFNSEVVAWNIERVKDPDLGSTARASFLVIDQVETPDESTAVFRLSEPSAGLMALLTDRGGAMISRQAAEELGEEFGSRPVGTGPFSFDQWVSGSNVQLRKNPEYWRQVGGTTLPYLDGVNIRIIPDQTAGLAALVGGDVQLAGVGARDVPQVESNGSLQLLSREGSGIATMLSFNHGIAPTDNADLRRAIAYAVNPEAVNQAVYFGRAIVADAGMWPVGTWVHQPVENRPRYDPDQARQFLETSGAGDGLQMPLITWGSTHQQTAEIFQQQLKEIGIDTNIVVQDVGQATENFFQGNEYPVYVTSWSLYPEPDWIASLCYDEEGFYNPAKVSGAPGLQDLIERGRRLYDEEERREIYHEINQLVLGEALFVPMLYGVAFVGAGNNVQNLDRLYTGNAKWRYDELALS